jgi:23S rRNA-/tRNA-specific pseudouridylate synthase
MLEAYLGLKDQDFSPHLIHRLDRKVSGLMVLGKTKEFASTMSEAF